jgi:hypothetical protein
MLLRTMQRLRSLQGVGYSLPMSLPPLLETLDWNAWLASTESMYGGKLVRPIEKLKAVAEAVCGLKHLTRLTIQQCLMEPMPLSFVSQIPITLQVGWQWSLLAVRMSWEQLCMQWCGLASRPCYNLSHWRWIHHLSIRCCPTMPWAGVASALFEPYHALDPVEVHSLAETRHDTAASWLQVATFKNCRLNVGADGEMTHTQWQLLVAKHMQVMDWVREEDKFSHGRGGDVVSFKLEARPGLL